MESGIKAADHLSPFQLTIRDFIEFLFYVGSEIIIEDITEIIYQEIVYKSADIRRE